jgi:hypothetical protein
VPADPELARSSAAATGSITSSLLVTVAGRSSLFRPVRHGIRGLHGSRWVLPGGRTGAAAPTVAPLARHFSRASFSTIGRGPAGTPEPAKTTSASFGPH